MSEDSNITGENTEKELNRRAVLGAVGSGMIVATGLGAMSGSALGSDGRNDVSIEELNDKEIEQTLETIQQTAEFDMLVEYYEHEGFDVNVNETSAFEVDRVSEEPYQVYDIPTRSDKDAIERAAITVMVKTNGEMNFEGTWGVKRPNKVDEIVTVRVDRGTVEMNRIPASEPTTGDESNVTPRDPWLPDIDCEVCKQIADQVCVKGCGVSYGTTCTFLTGALLKRACKQTAKEMCEAFDDQTNACGKGASFICNNVVSYC